MHSPSSYTGSVAYSNSHFDGARWDDTEGAAGTIGVLMMLVSGDRCVRNGNATALLYRSGSDGRVESAQPSMPCSGTQA